MIRKTKRSEGWTEPALNKALDWLIAHSVNVIAGMALVFLIATTIMGSMANPPFMLEPDKRPFVYDLSLAILGAWVFQQLLITLPARRKLRQYFIVFRPQLFTIAESGRQLLRDFEFISRCPHLPATPEHIRLVLTATNFNSATEKLFIGKMVATWQAVEDLTLSAHYLSEDIQHAIQVLRQNPLVRDAHTEPGWHITLEEARMEDLQLWDPFPDSEQGYVRQTWDAYARNFTAYYDATQVIANEISKSKTPLKVSDRPWRDTPELDYPLWERDAKSKGHDPDGYPYPYTAYPPTAYGYGSLASLMENPAPAPTAEEEQAMNEVDDAEARAAEEHFRQVREERNS